MDGILAYKTSIQRAISNICEVGQQMSPSILIEEVVSKEQPNISLWQCLDIRDFSTARFFVAPRLYPPGLTVFEVDFLSRHEIMPPMNRDKMPSDWLEWGVVVDNNIHVLDREVFLKTILTPEMFLALPKYRFEAFCDDIQASQEDSNAPSVPQSIFNVLTSKKNGYSFLLFLDNPNPMSYSDVITLSYIHSCLEGKRYEKSDLHRLASEQLQLWTS